MLHFKTFNYIDKACTGMEAFSLLLPEGWSFEGGVGWSLDDVMMPATCGFEARGGGIAVRALPGQAFFWTGLPQVRLGHPTGSRYLGAVVCPVLGAMDVIKSLMLPSLRPNAIDLSVIEESTAAKFEGLLGFGETFTSYGEPSSEGALLWVEYRMDGGTYEEMLFCTVTSLKYSVPAGGSSIDYAFWTADNMFSFAAEKGTLEENAGLLQSLMYSFRLNPAWYDKYSRIALYLKDRQVFKPYSLRDLSRDVESAPIRASSYPAYALRQSAYRWIADHIGGPGHTGEYYDPVQQICVRLPAGYEHAWSNDMGEYLLTDSGDFQPDKGFTEIWKMMEPISLEASAEPSAASTG